jgi:hypothetical protein
MPYAQALADINMRWKDCLLRDCAAAKETNMLPSTFSCPRCKCGACHRLHRKGFDWLLSVFGLRPMGCLTCGKKFYSRNSVLKTHLEDATTDVYSNGGSGKPA